MLGRHLLKCLSRTRATVALSSAEAELYAAVKALAETLGPKSLLKDFGQAVARHVLGDASAAIEIIKRQGLGKRRHVDTSYLWVQQASAEKRVLYEKVDGRINPADGQTKSVGMDLIERYCGIGRCTFPIGTNEFGFGEEQWTTSR